MQARSSRAFLTFENGTVVFPDTSLRSCHSTLRKIPKREDVIYTAAEALNNLISL